MNSLFTLKKIVATSLLALSLPFSTLAMAHDDGPHDGTHCSKGGQHQGYNKSGFGGHLKALGLSDKQKDEVFALMHNQAPAFRAQHQERVKLMAELRATSQADQFDDAKAQQIADRLAVLDKDRTLAHARNGAKIYALLTPEQRTKAREFKWERHGSHNEHEGHQPTAFQSHQREEAPQAM